MGPRFEHKCIYISVGNWDRVCFEFVVVNYYVAAGRFKIAIVDSLLQSYEDVCPGR